MSEADNIKHRERMAKVRNHLANAEGYLSLGTSSVVMDHDDLKKAVIELHKAVNEIQEAL